MPPALYCVKTGLKYESKEQMLTLRRVNDNKKQKIRYWRKKYNYDLTLDDYEKFMQINKIIKYIHKYHDLLIKYNPDAEQTFNKEELEIYVKNHKHFKDALPHIDYIRTLKLINQCEPKSDLITITF